MKLLSCETGLMCSGVCDIKVQKSRQPQIKKVLQILNYGMNHYSYEY
jgi:hypothetical protein